MIWIEVKHNIPSPRTIKDIIESEIKSYIDTAGKTIEFGIKKNIMDSISVTGARLLPLTESTKARKKGKGYRHPFLPLYRLGILHRAIHYYRSRPFTGFVGIIARGKPSRREVAGYHVATRPFFGISPSIRSKLNRKFNVLVDKVSRRLASYKEWKKA